MGLTAWTKQELYKFAIENISLSILCRDFVTIINI